ncbi:MAG: homogentisate 1,2-dioxygenase [Acidimicrobiaceae bacterium]|nr:homogentisate 1,2-dioxygenase [Acidimicrobiaceae bacterium]
MWLEVAVPYYRTVGEVPKKRHTQFRGPDGGLYAEELMGAEGFSGASALLYHRHAPTDLVAADTWQLPEEATVANQPLMPRHFKAHKLDAGAADVVTGRQLLLANSDVRLSYVAADADSPLYRNARGDECAYIESGRAVVETVFGPLAVGAGDYVVLPRSTTHRWRPSEPLRALIIEGSGHIGPPKRYLSATGQFLEVAPYCERDLRGPDSLPEPADSGEAEVFVRHDGGGTRYLFSHHPFDVVGWDGCLYPYAFNIADFEPLVGRVHLPPPVHQTFEGPGFVVCSFCPRPFDFDPAAVPVPYNHANVDSDEVLFYVGGDFMSRRGAGIEVGSLTLHPSGFVHGPQPGSVEASLGQTGTEEWAVMVDTFRPLQLGPAALATEDTGYAWTWHRSQ